VCIYTRCIDISRWGPSIVLHLGGVLPLGSIRCARMAGNLTYILKEGVRGKQGSK